VKEKKPTLVFLMETKMRNTKMQVLRNKLGYDDMFTMEPVGRSGGVALERHNRGKHIELFYEAHLCQNLFRRISEPMEVYGFLWQPEPWI
jgi:hypothetical protein